MSEMGRFLRLATSGMAGGWVQPDQPLDSLWCAVQVNNSEHLCEENNLRKLFEYDELYEDLFGSLGYSGDVATFPWDAVPGQGTGDNGSLVLCTGRVRLRPHGTSGKLPSVEWRWRWSSGLDGGSPVVIGAVAVVMPTWQRPGVGHPYASTTYSDSAWGGGSLSVDLTGMFSPEPVAYAPIGGTVGGSPEESGRVPEVVCWIGFWSEYLTKTVCSSVASVCCFLEAP